MLKDTIVKQICPEFPNDRFVVETMNMERFWKIIGNELYVPTQSILRGNLPMLSKYVEAIYAFAHMTLQGPDYSWSDLHTREYFTEDECLMAIYELQTYKMLSVDIETKHVGYNNNAVLMIGFAYSSDSSIVIGNLSPKVIENLNQLFARTDIIFIWQNGKFDTSRLKYLLKIAARVDEDTMLLHYAGINEHSGTHGLKDLGELYLQAPKWESVLAVFRRKWCSDHGVKLEDFTYDMIPREILVPYLHRDAIATFRLLPLFKKLARPGSEKLYRMLIRASNVYREIELNGCQLDRKYLYELQDKLDDLIVEAERDVAAAAKTAWDPKKYATDTAAKTLPTVFNHKSPKQLAWMLRAVTGRRVTSTDKDALKELEQDFPNTPFIKAIASLRKYNKYMDTYVLGIDSVVCADGRVRCSFNLHGTETGRLSSSDPNMQNIPRAALIKNLFIAAPGYKFVQFDYSQVELRVLAYLSQDPYLMQTYKDGKDLHDAMALKLFGPSFTKEQRVAAKTVNFGIPYGRGASTIAQQMNMPFSDAQKLLRDWYAAAPVAKKYIDGLRAGIRTPHTTIFGRQRHFVITNDNLYSIQNEAVNFPIQATASDCTLLSVCEIHEAIQREGINARIVNTVHDSIIVEVEDNDDTVERVSKLGKEIMAAIPVKNLPNLDFPFKADVEVGYKWGELEK